MSVKRNIIANYLGAGWSALMGIAFIPLYIRYLGIEAYGLIGVFTLLQSWLALLDVGLTPTLSREMARFEAGAHTAQSIRDLMSSMERIYFGIAVIVASGVYLAAPWLAANWIQEDKLSVALVSRAFAITGGVIAMRWLAGLYRSALTGLQKQVWLNGCTAVFSTLRGLGAVSVMAGVAPTVFVFFCYQGILSAFEALVLAIQVRRFLPAPPQPASFRWHALRQIWRFASGMAAIALLSILLMQVDKLMLSRLLPLTEFGYYTLASTVTGALSLVIGPINNAIYPRFVELVARNEIKILAETYHKFSQLLSLMLVPTALLLLFFSKNILLLWTHDVVITTQAAPLLSILAIGAMLNGLMHTPYTLQLAYGWTRLAVIVNSVSVLVIVPIIYLGVHAYGAISAAFIWSIINASYIAIVVPIMHRKLLPEEMWQWFGRDTVAPVLASFAVAAFVYIRAPGPDLNKPLENLLVLIVATTVTFSAAILATPLGRGLLLIYFRPAFKGASH